MFDHRTAITVTPVVGKDVIGHATDIFGEVAHQVASLQDSVVRKQLIAAGWTPPEVHAQDTALIRQLVEALDHLRQDESRYGEPEAAIAAARARLNQGAPQNGD